MEILQSIDYGSFTTITGNRNINSKKVEKLAEDVKSGFNLLPYCPIIVREVNNKKLAIIDGQHRFETCVATNEPVYYLIKNDITLQQIAKLNSRGQKWTVNDFLNCYVKLGIQNYITLGEICREFKVSVSTVCGLLMKNNVKANCKEEFESGEFKVNYLESTKKYIALTEELFAKYSFSKDRCLIGAVREIDLAGKCDWEVLKDKISQNPNGMDKNGDVKNYIYNIERVYNYKNSIRKTIY
jgi:hypothetical protein